MALNSTPDLLSINSEVGLSNQGLVECIARTGRTGIWDDQLDFASYTHSSTGGLKFDGVNDHINFGNPTAVNNMNLEGKTTVWSATFNFSLTSTSYRSQFINYDSSATNGNRAIDFHYLENTGTFRLTQIGPGAGQIATWAFTPVLNTKYNIAIVKNGLVGNWNMYINGSLKTRVIVMNTTTTILPPTKLQIGDNYGATAPFRGSIYDFKLFTKALTSTEVTDLYNGQGSVVPATAASNLLIDVRFDEGQGTTASDQSGNGMNGTLTNYAAGTTTFGTCNYWIDDAGNPRTS